MKFRFQGVGVVYIYIYRYYSIIIIIYIYIYSVLWGGGMALGFGVFFCSGGAMGMVQLPLQGHLEP